MNNVNDMTIDITVALLTFNSEKTLAQCLDSIVNQDYEKTKYEIIAIDNGSSDDTINILKKYNISYWVHPDLNISQLRNVALSKSTADIVGFVDSDCIIAADWISKALEVMRNEGAVVVGYKYLLPDNPTYFEKNWLMQNKRKVSYSDIIPAGNMIMAKKTVMSIHGFDETLATGEDADLLERLRQRSFKTVSCPDIKNKHLGNPKSLKGYFKKELWYGTGTKWKDAIINLDKPFIMSIVFLGSLFMLGLGLLTGSNSVFVSAAFAIVLVPFIAALDRKFRKSIAGNLLYMMVVYVVYFSARNAAFICYLLKIKSVEKK